MAKLFEPITVTVDKERHLLFDCDAVLMAQREINRIRGVKPADHVAIEVVVFNSLRTAIENGGILPLDLMGVMLWAGVRHEDKSLSSREAIEIVYNNRGISFELTKALIDAWNASWPVAPAEVDAKKNESAEPTGLNSGHSQELN